MRDETASVQRALDLAYRHLARRERTEHELRTRLAQRDIEAEVAEEALAMLRERGHVDDAGYARRLVEDRRTLDGWGRERIERRLRSVSISEDLIAAALAGHDADGERAAALELLRRRHGVGLPDAPARRRALGMLVRKGYELETAAEAVRAHAFGSARD